MGTLIDAAHIIAIPPSFRTCAIRVVHDARDSHDAALIGVIAPHAGAAWPAFTVLFGSVFDDLGMSLWFGDKEAFRNELYGLILYFLYLAIAAMISNFLEMSLIPIAGKI